jgi:hypothetical protein
MTRTLFSYPARLDPEDGRLVVHFPDLPEALTDGADKVEALREAADCYQRRWPRGWRVMKRFRHRAGCAADSWRERASEQAAFRQ